MYPGQERRSGRDRRQEERRRFERRERIRHKASKSLFKLVSRRRRTGSDRRQTERRQLLRRRSDIEALEKKLDLRNGLYFFREKMEGLSVGPYCTVCFEVRRKLVPVKRNTDPSRKLATYLCPQCGAIY